MKNYQAKLTGNAKEKLYSLWDTWSPEAVKDFYDTLVDWHQGTGYMMEEDEELNSSTPFDIFESKHPKEMSDYASIIDSSAGIRTLYRVVLFEQAEDLVQEVIRDEEAVDELAEQLDWDNSLHLMEGEKAYGHPDMFVDFSSKIDVRKYSSWTSKAQVARKLAFEGGQYQIGEGAVVVRSSSVPEIAHVFDGALYFENWLKSKSSEYKPFMAQWKWQVEYVVRSNTSVNIDRVYVTSDEGSAFHDAIKEAKEEWERDYEQRQERSKAERQKAGVLRTHHDKAQLDEWCNILKEKGLICSVVKTDSLDLQWSGAVSYGEEWALVSPKATTENMRDKYLRALREGAQDHEARKRAQIGLLYKTNDPQEAKRMYRALEEDYTEAYMRQENEDGEKVWAIGVDMEMTVDQMRSLQMEYAP